MNSAFDLPRREHAGNEIRADADRLQLGSESIGCDPPVWAGDHPHVLILKWGHYPGQVIGRDKDVAVVDKDMVMPGKGQHLNQVAGLAVVPQHVRTHQEPDVALREFFHQFVDCFNRRIVGVAHAENDFVCRIILDAVTAEALIHLRIHATQWFQDRNWPGETGTIGLLSALKGPRTPQAQGVEPYPAESETSGNHSCYKLKHCARSVLSF